MRQRPNTAFRGVLRGACFDILGDFWQRGARVGGEKFSGRDIVQDCDWQ